MNNNLSVLVKRYLVAAFIALVGLIMIFIGLSTKQDGLFMIAAINLFIGGVLAILFSAGILSRGLVLVIGAICIIATVGIGVLSVKSVQNTIQHEKDFKRSEALNIFMLNQIRDVQRAYRLENGVYAKDYETLKNFFENDKIIKVESIGAVPGRRLQIVERDALYTDKRSLDHNMTEREAALLVALGNPGNFADLANFRRDTVAVYFKDEFLESGTRNAMREALGLGEFKIEELKYVPMTDPKEEWIYETRDEVPYLNNDTIATIHIYGYEAVPKFEGGERNIIGFGNLSTNSDKGTWE